MRAAEPMRHSGAVTPAALVLFTLALGATAASPAVAAGGFAIVGATVLDGTGGPGRRAAVLLVDGERIAALGSRAEVSLPKGVRIVDGRGKWVMPGLVDAHVHFFQSGGG